MLAQPTRFTFSFAELAPALPEPALRVVAAAGLSVPDETEAVAPTPRPRWMPRLLPVFQANEPMRIDIVAAAAPPFGARLRASLGALYATAGAESCVRVATWNGGLGVGAHGAVGRHDRAHAVLVVAALERTSVAAALQRLNDADASRTWLVLDGDVPRADATLGVDVATRVLPPAHVMRLPCLGSRDLGALADGRDPGIARRRTGLRHLALAAALVRAYLEQQP